MLVLEYGKRARSGDLKTGQTIYYSGIGCRDYPNCFNCPKEDCNYRAQDAGVHCFIWSGDAFWEAIGND